MPHRAIFLFVKRADVFFFFFFFFFKYFFLFSTFCIFFFICKTCFDKDETSFFEGVQFIAKYLKKSLSMNEWINQSVNQSVNQSINQSINIILNDKATMRAIQPAKYLEQIKISNFYSALYVFMSHSLHSKKKIEMTLVFIEFLFKEIP